MRKYAVVAPTFWTRGSGKRLRGYPEAQALAHYLFTCSHGNMIGLYFLPLGWATSDVGWDVGPALARIIGAEIAEYDPEAELMYLPQGAFYQIGASLKAGDKRVRGVELALEPFRYHDFANRFIERYRERYSLTVKPNENAQSASPFTSPFISPFRGVKTGGSAAGSNGGGGSASGFRETAVIPGTSEAPTKALRSQDQDQDQDQKQDQEQEQEQAAAEVDRVWQHYIEKRAEVARGNPPRLNETRKAHIRKRLKAYGIDRVLLAIDAFLNPDSWYVREKRIQPELVFRSDEQLEKHEVPEDAVAPRELPPRPPDDVIKAEHDRVRAIALGRLTTTPEPTITPEQAVAELDKLKAMEGV